MISLKPLVLEDSATLAELASLSNLAVSPWLSDFLCPTSHAETLTLINYFNTQNTCKDRYAFMLQNSDTESFVGMGFINAINTVHRFCNIGYWIASNQTGQGFATQSAAKLIEFAREELNMIRMELVIEPANTASAAVALKVGCIKEARLARRIFGRDAAMYAYLES